MSRYPGEYMPSANFLCKSGDTTFGHDETLPALPVPDLDSTLDKYLESVVPHLSAQELRNTRKTVEDFRNNEGPKLQRILQERAKHHKNWLTDWWLSYAYLKLRFPISPLMNVCGMGPYVYHLWPPTEGTQIQRNALSLYMLLEHWQLMRNERLVCESGRAGSEPWSMDQFRSLYNCCRTPGLEEDTIHRHFKTVSEGSVPTHIVILCNRRMYKINSVLNSRGQLCTPPQLESVLRQIKTDAFGKPPGIGLSSLTTEERTTWYHLRQHLLALSDVNRDNLEIIQTAIINNSLLEEMPRTMEQMAQHGLVGQNPGNVWFDKCYSAMWFANGTTVSNCDHAPMDAMTSVNVSYYADCRIIESRGMWQGPPGDASDVPTFRELEFVVDQSILDAIDVAERKYLRIARNVEIINPEFSGFGKDLLRKNKLHPDSFIQICLQYGYYKLHKKPAPTYETATTRKFYMGRTETVRSCTNEAVLFSKAMLDPTATPAYKIQLFRRAIDKHLSVMRESMSGQGVDRHMLGLKIAATENDLPTPHMFNDVAFEKSGGNGNYTLSTSFIGFTSVHGGVLPMCSNGYGFFYRMSGTRIIFFISSWISDEETSAVKLYETVKDAMVEVVGLLSKHAVSSL